VLWEFITLSVPTPALITVMSKPMQASKSPGKKSRRRPKGHKYQWTYDPVTISAKRVRLVWVASKAATEGSAGAGAYNTFRLNSAYDVDTSLGSTTTPGFAEIQNYYTNYRVWSTAIRVEGSVFGGSSGSIANVVLLPNANVATIPSTPSSWGVQPYSERRVVNMQAVGGRNSFTLEHHYDLPKLAHVTRQQYRTDMDYSAPTTSNPTRQMYAFLTVWGINTSIAVEAIYMIYVEMEVEFFNPVTLSI